MVKLSNADISVPEDAVLPPAQVGRTTGHASYIRNYTISEAFCESELVCLARVGDWLGEDSVGTFYEAAPLEVYKGGQGSPFVLWVFGNSEFTLRGRPLYTYGDLLLLFLIRRPRGEHEGAYESIGADLTVFRASLGSGGEVFLFDREAYDRLAGQGANETELEDMGCDGALVRELCRNMSGYDKLAADDILRSLRARACLPESELPPLRVFSLGEAAKKRFNM